MSVQSEITRISNAKTSIADAISATGVNVPSGTKISGMASLIQEIPHVPAGGSAGQVLKKQSATDYDTAWETEDLNITGASVGDLVRISAVDANNKPTAFDRISDPNENIGIVQNTNTATQNISEGQYVIWHGALYIAAAAIASGASLNAGSGGNLTAVTDGGLNYLCQRDEITLTYESGVTPQNFSKLYAVGKVHVLSLSIFVTKEATQANWYKVATIPDGHRPDINIYPYNFILSAYQVLIEAGTGQIAIASQSAMSNQLVRTYVAWIV